MTTLPKTPHMWNSRYGIGTLVEYNGLWCRLTSTAFYDLELDIAIKCQAVDPPGKPMTIKIRDISHVGRIVSPPPIQDPPRQRHGMFFCDADEEAAFLDQDPGYGDPAYGDWGSKD